MFQGLEKEVFRVQKGTRLEYTLSLKIASETGYDRDSVTLGASSALPREGSQSLVSYLIHSFPALEKQCREGLITETNGGWEEKTLKMNPLKLRPESCNER